MKGILAKAALFVAFAVSAVAAMVAFRHAGFGVLAIIVISYMCVLVLVLAIVLNYPRQSRLAVVNEFADDLQARGLLVYSSYHADRAFRVEPLTEHGPHYFLELENNDGVLHLNGAYLYDYEPGAQNVRHFPCTEFTLRTHALEGYVVDILCGGLVIEPEAEAPPFTQEDYAKGRVPGDGQILSHLTYDEVRAQRMAARQPVQ
jgi:hypothetical protein